MLTLAENLKRWLFRGSTRIRFVFEFAIGGTTYRFHDGAQHIIDVGSVVTAESIRSVSALNREFDPLEGKINGAKATVSLLLDPRVRKLVKDNRLIGETGTIWIGCDEVLFGEWAKYLGGKIADIRPDVRAKEVTFELKGGLSHTFENAVSGYWWNHHPLQIAKDVVTRAGVPSSLYTASDFDPSQAKYADMGHLVFNNALVAAATDPSQQDAAKPRKAVEVLQELGGLIDVQFVDGEDGKLRAIFFDSTAAIVDTWSDPDDFWDFKQVSVLGPLKNRINCLSHDIWREQGVRFTRNDTASQANWGAAGNPRVESLEYRFGQWMHGIGVLRYDTDTLRDPAMAAGDVGGAFRFEWVHPWSGMRWSGNYPDGSQPAEAAINNSNRKLYVMIDEEIVEFTALAFGSTATGSKLTWITPDSDPHDSSALTIISPASVTCTLSARGLFGTTAADHAKLAVAFDVTPQVWLAQRKLTRFRNGAPIVRCKTRFDKFGVQIGDFIAFVTSHYIGYGADGLDANTKWQCIGKNPQAYAAEPYIEWAFMRALEPSPPSETTAYSSHYNWRAWSSANIGAVLKQDVAQWRAARGLAHSSSAGLAATIARGDGSAMTASVRRHKDDALTLRASKDNYVGLSLTTPAYLVSEVANGAAEPDAAPGVAPLHKISTDATAVTGSVDRRVTRALSGALLVAATIDDDKITALRSLVQASVVDASKNINFAAGSGWANKNLDNLADGTTWRRVASVNASNLIVNASVDAAAGIVGSKLTAGTGPLTHLSSTGFLDNLTSITTRSLDNITDGATYKKVAGVSASNQVQAASIAAEAVTAAKIADNAVGYRMFNIQGVTGVGGIVNSDLQIYSRG